ncbi:Outer membrane protein TolC [Azotobacter beijerinckii]|uniref:Outer membrane protein TolC n=1 Tax=Azotobacter beijerinckii TaxID=170623 RepID=A0A1H9I6U3_9GAMM|nr:TolC family protein [Azotobacter beijerinckii]SEQ70297.1 Outer membrane protein TolC [Azotobacter beijerinckii]
MKRFLRAVGRSAGLSLFLALSACDLAPTYQPPELVVPANWNGKTPSGAPDQVVQSDWWKLYKDPVLDRIEEQATANNADLQAAGERFQQARDTMMQARSKLMPQAILGFGASASLVSWEPDIWSAIRNETKAQTAVAQQRAAEYAAARLSLQAEIAHDYFALRGLDAQDANYRQSITHYEKSLEIVQTRVAGLLSPKLDAVRAQELLYNTRAEELDIQAQRQVMEHAIAILANVSPSEFHIEPVDSNMGMQVPETPVSVPSQLLQRRPDIARAERMMAEANRSIGVQRASFYPNVSLEATDLKPEVAIELPLFTGGARRAGVQKAWSMYRETGDNYRSTVLNAFREVEDGLSRVSRLGEEVKNQHAAVDAAGQTQNMTMELYKGGLNTSLDLIVAQVNTLTSRSREVQIKTELLQASAELIRALGGGWERSALPTPEQIQPFGTLQYGHLDKSPPAGGIDVNTDPKAGTDLTLSGLHGTSSPH